MMSADGAIGADAAVAHDLQLPLPRPAAAETVRRIGKPVFMQAAGNEHRGGQRQRCREARGQAKRYGERIGDAADHSDGDAGQRRGPDRLRQSAVAKIEFRQRQPREEHEA